MVDERETKGKLPSNDGNRPAPKPKPKTDAEKYPCPDGFDPVVWKRKGVGYWKAYYHSVKGSEF